ncbi:hypothetical protein PCANC_01989 [Puccinia coronata f. sp. avenae]|uniref:Uncharacterized protein n=1 Tax=Puccinia coronata f. sp. avenae TaxID=200324 RepID=A0A2N5UT90_9BASI|nr:hypothetical protein PCASD_19498 [Puccinia coronata f. sp. avenae]PLW19757.1 hypothetical protein PCANC_07643 [Puccinia coronata f. sp. avenae]PLW40963.1 hypothetical protein PCASD_06604 [Puccinia coronata f. sp. avenae]PLW56237.1 hypothetical protein PCANC_01989 [Puccinia coronata f. sp. avenae]
MSHLITTTSGPPTKEEIAKSIAQCTSKYYPRLGLSGVDPTLRGSQLKLGKLYEFITNSISAGIWKFSLPIEDGKFDVEYLKRNPIARLSWFLEDLDAEEMMKYAQAFQEPEIGITIPQMVARQTILEQPDKTDPREQFAASRWFLQHVGWDCFQKTMLEYEKFPSGNRKIKGKVFRNPQRSNREKSSPSQGVQGFWRNKLDSILKENSFPQLPEQDQFSENIMEWLANFLTWLNKSNVQVRRLPSLKIS